MTKLDKIKVDKKSKLEAKDNIQEELIAKDEIKKSLWQKHSEADTLTETRPDHNKWSKNLRVKSVLLLLTMQIL